MIFQPAYSPELMPVKHIWQDIREKHFSNYVYKLMAGVEDALCVELLALYSNSELLRSLTFVLRSGFSIRLQLGITYYIKLVRAKPTAIVALYTEYRIKKSQN